MADQRKGRSGKTLFALLTLGILSAIAATVLLANDYRNLNRLLDRLGYAPVQNQSAAREPLSHEIRGKRIPRPKVEIPERLVSDLVPMETKFRRQIRRDPKDLCAALERSGFLNAGWKEGLAKGSWECTSYREFPVQEGTSGPASSAYLSIRGSDSARLSSFRIKLNLENEDDRAELTDAAIAAVEVFLDEVRWKDAPEIVDSIRNLREFDVVVFGNRIQLKKEFGETPRYNFIITPDRTRPKDSYLPDYFNREKWLPMPEKPLENR
ncbi:hypothetical protein J2Y48_000797 [Mycoplana sp. BE70]|uniref:DUF6030 family protein n=1 Tax=Mycoplana sp. BE70 TaxID=2817775 RepID=UPI0028630A03|nr:DUF6030 family protein [Mycoplana sp. BE70]MDR6755512.1 hypothetical protein [Mycoplana sp. BE70]